MYDLNNFCNIIAELRREKGWSQAVFADMLGISPQSVSKWECGIGFPDVTMFPVIAETLSVPIGVLFGEKTEEEDTTMEKKPTVTEFKKEFEVSEYIDVVLGNLCRVEIIDGERQKALVHAVGDPTFIRFFSIEREPGRMLVEIKNPNGSTTEWDAYDREGYEGENYVQIFSGCEDSDNYVSNYLNLCATTYYPNENGNYEVVVTVVPN